MDSPFIPARGAPSRASAAPLLPRRAPSRADAAPDGGGAATRWSSIYISSSRALALVAACVVAACVVAVVLVASSPTAPPSASTTPRVSSLGALRRSPASSRDAPLSALASGAALGATDARGSGGGGSDGGNPKTRHAAPEGWGVGSDADLSADELRAKIDAMRRAFDPPSVGLPRDFDARVAFPACAALNGGVRDQGECGSCWAMAATEVMNDRLCVKTNGAERRRMSAQFTLACTVDHGNAGQNGCRGGSVGATLDEARTLGVPFEESKSKVDSDSNADDADDAAAAVAREGEGETDRGDDRASAAAAASPSAPSKKTEKTNKRKPCLGYQFKPCEHPCQNPEAEAASCPAACDDGEAFEKAYPTTGAVACPAGDWACVAREIHAHGSIAVTFGTVHDDFYAHKTGIYRVADAALGRSGLGDHATKLIGWGFDDETKDPYWLMMNSWANWGEDGVGKVGVGEMNLEGEAVGVQM